jgi:FMN-dependent NADH-azoreductase
MNILHIDCSIRDQYSVSKALSGQFTSELTDKFSGSSVDYLDLSKNTPAHPTALFIKANYSLEEERTAEMKLELAESEALVDRLIHADYYVIGMPMYNFSVPSNFKVFIDAIVRINRTFRMSESGIEGLLKNKKVFLINTRGADFNHPHMASMDQLTPYIRTVFGFMGIVDISFIDVSPVQFSLPAEREAAIENAREQISAIISSL